MRTRQARWWIAPAFLVLAGCGGIKTAPVSGTVKMDGKPLERAIVTFRPVAAGPSSSALTDATGRYALVCEGERQGAVVGDHRVLISTYDEIISGDRVKIVPETVPSRYNARSELTATVRNENNSIDFDLDSDGVIAEQTF